MARRETEQKHSASTEEAVSSLTLTEADHTTEDGAPVELGLDTVFDALKNARRRRLLRYLNEQNGHVTLSDLAEHVAAIENDTTPEALDSQQRKRVYVGLYQSHLPKLDRMGVLTFDQQRGIIELTPAASQLDKYLYGDDTEPHGWKRHYIECLGVTAVVLLLSVVTGLIGSIVAVMSFIGIGIGVAGLAGLHASERL